MTTLALNVILFMASIAAMVAYYCRIDIVKYGVDPLGRIAANVLGGSASAWAMTQSAQMQADWRAWMALVLGLAVLVSTYRYTSMGQVQRARLQRSIGKEAA